VSPVLWLLAAIVALALVVWGYGVREERVPGRLGPAVLRVGALFLILAGLALPALRGRVVGAAQRVALLDLSRSMTLPVRPADPAAPSRLDSARAELAALDPDRVYAFGDDPVGLLPQAALRAEATDSRTRLRPAIEAAKLGGADSVWVFTDGAWSDRAEALETARGLGLGVREVRVAGSAPRVGIAAVVAPRRARGGDTVRIVAELRGVGGAAEDSVAVELRLDGAVLARTRVPRPTGGRTSSVELAFTPLTPEEESVWRRYEVVLAGDADPYGTSDRVAAWIEISESANGAVLVSTAPDWESRFLLPALERLVLGGARGFLRLSDGRYLEMAAHPRVVDAAAVQSALRGARLLVVQGAPDELPEWLQRALASHPRTLVMTEGSGEVPGAGVRLTGPLPGEWYAVEPIPPSPAAALLSDADLESLPPLAELYAVEPEGTWTVLRASRNRRGESRPLLVVGERGQIRWAVSPGRAWWRWASRGGAARRVYDGVMSGVVGWLVEDATSRLAGLLEEPTPGRAIEWRIRPDARDVSVRIVDDGGEEVFAGEWPAPGSRIVGPALPPGRYAMTIGAQGPDGPFREERPLEIAPDPAELLPTPAADVASVAAVVSERPAVEPRLPRPVWPFVLAVALLCVEWVWRHRIGLR